jgi:hypothetical protein
MIQKSPFATTNRTSSEKYSSIILSNHSSHPRSTEESGHFDGKGKLLCRECRHRRRPVTLSESHSYNSVSFDQKKILASIASGEVVSAAQNTVNRNSSVDGGLVMQICIPCKPLHTLTFL